ncbi:MaoC family dehydratase [Pseudomaricurvus alkylphenolicus]|uniref:MaoC family dehydratase n=1 Tax=Pseudomaricurvus alkylphenolicus TaxID=1306991 RepID=UPI001424A097|nr:MaoC family dehydratase [Pseudomaricurvus alkylphenolicus]NIB40081.1 MaoC family dehydratase [Pseudomaricurvus alkylphenolicus]
MSEINTEVKVGTEIPALELPPITRTTLALFAGASGDHNPIHIDIDFAKQAGMDDVFAHGMLSMAYLGRMLTRWQPQSKLRKFSNRFAAITNLQDAITCSGKVVELLEQEGETLARCEIQAVKATGEITLVGEALVAVNA